MSKPIRPFNVGDEVILLSPVNRYSCFIGGDVGKIVSLFVNDSSVTVDVRGDQQNIYLSDMAHYSTQIGGLFDGLTYG